MTTQTEALKLSLAEFENQRDGLEEAGVTDYSIDELITTIKEALAQPEQTNTRPYYTIDELNAWADEKEKQAWRNAAIRIGEELSSVGPDGYYDMNAWQWLDWAMKNVKKAQPEQEPVAWMSDEIEDCDGDAVHDFSSYQDNHCKNPLYTTPPQRKPLTDEEIGAILEGVNAYGTRLYTFARAIEAVHGIKELK
jgi:hypothetical protein